MPLHPTTGTPYDPGPLLSVPAIESHFDLLLEGKQELDEVYVADVVEEMLRRFTPKKVRAFADVAASVVSFLNTRNVRVPDDFQFQHDAKVFVQKVRLNNPNALILLVGHGSETDVCAASPPATAVSAVCAP